MRCTVPNANWSRQGYSTYAADSRLAELQNAATAILQKLHDEQLRMLGRLGISAESPQRGEALFYRMLATSDSARTRSKLSRAWRRTRDARLPELIEVVDAMVQIRHQRSREHGYDSALDRTLRRCHASAPTVASYLDRYLVGALASHTVLERDVCRTVADTGDARDHFGYYARALADGATIPRFGAEDCVRFISFVAERFFGPAVIERLRAHSGVDGLVGAARGEFLTFQEAHGLFHRFGHAIDQLLDRDPPLERFEDLSMWFEKWVYHPQFADLRNLTAEERAGLAVCQRMKLLEFRRGCVDRAVLAALDFQVHGRPGLGLRDAFEELDARFGVSRFCDLGDFPVYFTWPRFQVHPGGNFGYLWGAAASAESFRLLLARRIEEAGSPDEVRAMFSVRPDAEGSGGAPDPDAVFAFPDPSPPENAR